jgi:cyclophilin family peptidyl-prolyl cis-trans isomerase
MLMRTVLVALCLFLTSCASTQPPVEAPATAARTQPQAAASTVQENEIVKIKIETTKGDILVDLYAKEAPKTVENFMKLAKKGFYDGIIFHRVIPQFMVQTGDPTGTGMGGPGYTFADEFSPKLKHDKPGVLSMANSGPNTNGSQFFITEVPTPWLDGRHSIFGQVTSGMEVVKAIVSTPRDSSDKPLETIAMKKVTVLEKA